jgi:hypothetical protein
MLLYVFTNGVCLVFCGTDSALLVFVVVMPSSHNIATSLCYIVGHFILAIVIIRYDYKLIVNTVVRTLFVVGTCRP